MKSLLITAIAVILAVPSFVLVPSFAHEIKGENDGCKSDLRCLAKIKCVKEGKERYLYPTGCGAAKCDVHNHQEFEKYCSESATPAVESKSATPVEK